MAKNTTKLEQIKQIYDAAIASKARLADEIADLERQIPLVNAAAQLAADAGNVESYTEKKSEAERISNMIFVKKSMLRKADAPISEDDAKAAWDEYIKPVDKELQKQMAGYLKARHELFEKFDALVNIYRQILKNREDCIFTTGANPYNDRKVLNDYPMSAFLDNDVSLDVEFFRKLGEYTAFEQAVGINLMVGSQLSNM